jgi:hypothetical protein
MDAAIEFTPEKAWQAALANLQMDMSRPHLKPGSNRLPGGFQ